MSTRIALTLRDHSLLRLLSWTPATTTLIHRASVSFESGGFGDERRTRERLQALIGSGFVRSWPLAQAGGGLQNYYKLTPLGFEMVCGTEAEKPSRAFFSEVSPSLLNHTFRLAEVIVEVVCACHRKRITIARFLRENELLFKAGDSQVQPDCFVRLLAAGRSFNLAFEVDNAMSSVDAFASNSIRTKLLTYEAYQDSVLAQWHRGGKRWERPRFRAIFLTPSIERAYHILSLARELTRNQKRCLILAAPCDSFITDPEPLTSPLFLDHLGHWQALVDLHPSAGAIKTAVRLPKLVPSPFGT